MAEAHPERSDQPPAEPASLRGLRVGVVGLGVEGVDIVRFLAAEQAAEIVVSDRRSEGRLAGRIAELDGIAFQLTSNDPELAAEIDVLFVSQGVPDDLPLIQAARQRGIAVTAMMRHFLHRCPVPTIGITGSAGKTTTTALVGAMFRAAGRDVFVGGNIGAGPLSALSEIGPATDVVLEVSHTQLARTDRSPHLAAVLNVTPNHLDQFSWDDYVALKRNLVGHQRGSDIVVLPSDDPVAAAFAADTPAELVRFGLHQFRGRGATVEDGRIVTHLADGPSDVCTVDAIRLPGEHNLYNVLGAVAITSAWGLPAKALADAIAAFEGVPHRLHTIAVVDGVRYIDDSIATAPERTVAALRALVEPVVLLLGGREKRLPLDSLSEEASRHARAVICFGEAGPTFAEQIGRTWAALDDAPPITLVNDLPAAIEAARSAAQRGDAVLLAPAGTSFDAYDNFEARGDHFSELVSGAGGNDGTR